MEGLGNDLYAFPPPFTVYRKGMASWIIFLIYDY